MEMPYEIKLPSPDKPRYTLMEYIYATKDAQPSDHERLLAEAKKRGEGFAFYYMEAMQQACDRHAPAWLAHNSRMQYTKASDDCRVLNRVLRNIREDVDISMQQYIAENKGVIDCWPSSCSAAKLEFTTYSGGKKDSTDFIIDYFAADLTVRRKDGVDAFKFESDQPVYRNESPVVDLPEKLEMDERIRRIRKTRTYSKRDIRKNRFRHIIARQAWVLAAIYIVLLLLSRFAGFDLDILLQWLTPFVDSDNVAVGALAFIPTLLVLLLMGIRRLLNISTIMFWLGIAGLAFLGYIGRYFLEGLLKLDDPWISRKMVKTGEKAEQDLRDLWNSEEYKRVMEDNRLFRAWQQEQSELWHRAWFERAQTSDKEEIDIKFRMARQIMIDRLSAIRDRMDEPDKPGDKPMEKAATAKPDKPMDKPMEKAADKPADKPERAQTPSDLEAVLAAELGGAAPEREEKTPPKRSLEDMLNEELRK